MRNLHSESLLPVSILLVKENCSQKAGLAEKEMSREIRKVCSSKMVVSLGFQPTNCVTCSGCLVENILTK